MKSFIKNNCFYFLGIIILILIWEIANLIYQNDLVFPDIADIIKSLGKIIITGKSYKIFLFTFLRLIIAFAISLLFAIVLAIASRKSNKIKQIITPFMAILKSTPIASIIIILLIVFGHQRSSIVIALFMMLPIQYEGFYNAFNNISKNIKDEIKMISNVNYIVVKEVYIPLTLPTVLTTFLQSISLGLKSLVMAELLTMPKYSIGSELLELKSSLNMSDIMAWTLILILISIVFEILVNKIKNSAEDI